MLNKFHLKYKSFETLYKSLYCHFGLIFCVFAELKNITDPKHWTIVNTVLKYALQINSQFLFESAQFSFAVGQLHSQSFRRFISKPTWRGYMGCRWFPFLTKLCYPLKIKKRHPKLKGTLSEHNCELIISSLTYLHLKLFSHLQVCVSLAEQVLDLFGHGAEESLQLGSIQPTHVSKLQRKHCAWVLGHLEQGRSQSYLHTTQMCFSLNLCSGYVQNALTSCMQSASSVCVSISKHWICWMNVSFLSHWWQWVIRTERNESHTVSINMFTLVTLHSNQFTVLKLSIKDIKSVYSV